jgi:TRAP-type uncharacterized transport system fused permease subunit
MAGGEDVVTWSTPELVRAVRRIEETTQRIEKRLSSEYVRQDVYQADARGLEEWKREVAVDVVNIEAEQARIRKEHRDDIDAFRIGQRWAVGIALTAAAVVVAGAGVLINVISAAGLG